MIVRCDGHEWRVTLGAQDEGWEMREELGKGCSGSVLAVNSLHYPNVVLKRGPLSSIQAEADKLWMLRHPNVVTVYAVLHSAEVTDEDEAIQYMALERLGPSLYCIMQETAKPYGLLQLLLPA